MEREICLGVGGGRKLFLKNNYQLVANIIPLKPGAGQNIAMRASPTASIFLFSFFFFLFFLVGCPKLYHPGLFTSIHILSLLYNCISFG